MILVKFSPPLTPDHLAQIEALAGEPVSRVLEIPCQMDASRPFTGQIESIVSEIELSPREWQTLPIVINPPSYNFAAAAVLAELEGRMGYLPSVLRLRPVEGAVVRQFEVAEIIDLAGVRSKARVKR